MKDISENELVLILDNCHSLTDMLYQLIFLTDSYDSFFVKHKNFLKKCFKKFSNLYAIAPTRFRNDENFIDAAVSVTASNILFIKDKITFEEMKKFVDLNPFVCIYSIDFVTKKEQNELFLEAFKNTGNEFFFNRIEDDSLKEQIFLDIYFNDFKCKGSLSENVLKESDDFIKSFSKEDLDVIIKLRGKSII